MSNVGDAQNCDALRHGWCGCSPKQPSAAVIVGALEDAYVTRESIRELAGHWPGSEVRWVPGGHVSAFLLQQPAFRTAIADSLQRLEPASDK